MNSRRFGAAASLVGALLICSSASAVVAPWRPLPAEVDLRIIESRPIAPLASQLADLATLGDVKVHFSDRSGTPRFLFRRGGFLTLASHAAPESLARNFLSEHRSLYRFAQHDLDSLQLKSRAVLADGTTVLLFEQTEKGLPIYEGSVLFTIAHDGRISSVGNENYPGLRIANDFGIAPAQAVQSAAMSLGIEGTSPAPAGSTRTLDTFGDLTPRWRSVALVDMGTPEPIKVQRTLFPMGAAARSAYVFNLKSADLGGVMWSFVVDAGTGQVLLRTTLTRFATAGPRTASFRTDIQQALEQLNPERSASGRVFDAYPTVLSALYDWGESTRTGDSPANYVYTQPSYARDSETGLPYGRGFKYHQFLSRLESGLPFANNPSPLETWTYAQLPEKMGQVQRPFADSRHPTPGSPFGWFYLPTADGGAPIETGDTHRAATKGFYYYMRPETQARNLSANSPAGDGAQPFSADVTALLSTAHLADGRELSSVLESRYTEGNNVLASDDRLNDDQNSNGVRGYSPDRQFDEPRFTFSAGYEYGSEDVGRGTYNPNYMEMPPSTDPDVYPGTVSVFYVMNLLHDYWYERGFTEKTWNFQQDNFGKGGAGSDAVIVEIQDGGDNDNANFLTPLDGGNPVLQVFLFTTFTVRRVDGAFDADLLAHEIFHGISTRSAGKGAQDCLGLTLVGEAGGQGEGWSDYNSATIADDDAIAEYTFGAMDTGIRRLPLTNYRWSYGSLNGAGLSRRDQQTPADPSPDITPTPFEVHDVGEVWSSTLWDMRELFIVRQPGGVFFDAGRRAGNGAPFYVGDRLVRSPDAFHPIDYRESFGDTDNNNSFKRTIVHIGADVVQRPRLLAAEVAARGDRSGPLATAIATGARSADTLVLTALQRSLCNPSIVDSRDTLLATDLDLYGGENRAIIWRALASHGVGVNASSTTGDDQASQAAPGVVEDFSVPPAVAACEANGPLAAPSFTVTNDRPNSVHLLINNGVPIAGADHYSISRSRSPNGPFARILTVPAAVTSMDDDDQGAGLAGGVTYYYTVRASADAQSDCTSTGTIRPVTILNGTGIPVADAGPDATLDELTHGSLDASASRDPEGAVLTFQWEQVGAPAVSNFRNTNTSTPGFDAPAVDADTALTFRVTVSDGRNLATDEVVVTVTNVAASDPPPPPPPPPPEDPAAVIAPAQSGSNNRVGGAMPGGLCLFAWIALLRRRTPRR